jgi:hypothetical protein
MTVPPGWWLRPARDCAGGGCCSDSSSATMCNEPRGVAHRPLAWSVCAAGRGRVWGWARPGHRRRPAAHPARAGLAPAADRATERRAPCGPQVDNSRAIMVQRCSPKLVQVGSAKMVQRCSPKRVQSCSAKVVHECSPKLVQECSAKMVQGCSPRLVHSPPPRWSSRIIGGKPPMMREGES